MQVHKPKLLIAGFSAYPRNVDFSRFKDITDRHNVILMGDIAHTAGLVAADIQRFMVDPLSEGTLMNAALNPFNHCDVVTTTCHKTLRGPRAALIFSRRSAVDSRLIDSAVFPGLQGGPHNNQIAATAVALREARSDEFVLYADAVRRNAVLLAEGLMARGHRVLTNGTDTHLLLVDLSDSASRGGTQLTGDRVEMLLEQCGVYVNKNLLPQRPIENSSSISPTAPKGIRLGTAALTTRFPDLGAKDVREIADIIHDGICLAELIEAESLGLTRINRNQNSISNSSSAKVFKEALSSGTWSKSLSELKDRVHALTDRFPVPVLFL